jgi:predicted metal-binding membrane protein
MLSIADRRFPAVLLASLIAISWITLMVWDQALELYPGHSAPNHITHGHPSSGTITQFAAVWVLMTVAMMLPTALPLVGLFHAMIGGRSHAGWLIVLLITGYVGIWTVFGFVAHSLVTGLQFAGGRLPLLDTSQTAYRSALLLIAGVYQFTPLKRHCLAKCRSPLSFIMERRRGRNQAYEALRIGLDHGIYCIGCCWSLMLLMFLAGSAHLLWMLALGTVMAIEKNLSWGARLSAPFGIFLTVAGLLLWL